MDINEYGDKRMQDILEVNHVEYKIVKLLGHGKGGYSYLAKRDGNYYVLKQIHHEPCDYYTFGNKIEAEKNDYQRLLEAGIRIPPMLDIDIENERISENQKPNDIMSSFNLPPLPLPVLKI